jgi:uncharacterized phage-associated protein
MAYDVREIANFVLDCADEVGRPVSNIDINKIVYFLHGWYLAKHLKPLVSAKIEAWTYGPVFRELYREFRAFGEAPISARAMRLNVMSGEKEECVSQITDEERDFLRGLTQKYLKVSTHGLIAMSHEAGGPWETVWQEGRTGMQITDKLICDYFSSRARN